MYIKFCILLCTLVFFSCGRQINESASDNFEDTATGEVIKEGFFDENIGMIVENEDGTQSIIADESLYGSKNIKQRELTEADILSEIPGEIIENADGTQSIIVNESFYGSQGAIQVDISGSRSGALESLGTIINNEDGTQSIILEE